MLSTEDDSHFIDKIVIKMKKAMYINIARTYLIVTLHNSDENYTEYKMLLNKKLYFFRGSNALHSRFLAFINLDKNYILEF